MTVYFDSSVLLRVLPGGGPVLAGWDEVDQPFASRLTLVEIRRVIDRVRLLAQVDDVLLGELWAMAARIEAGLAILPVTDEVLELAGQPMRTAVGTLEAIHLATAITLRSREVPDLVFATHDRQQAIGARALGFEVVGVEF